MDINIRIAGEAGQGVQTTGDLLVGAFALVGVQVLSTQSYLSRIRGGLNWYDVRIGDEQLFGGKDKADLLVALTDEAREYLGGELYEDGTVLFNGAAADGTIAIDFEKAATEKAGSKIYANTVAAGAVFGLLGYDLEKLCEYLAAVFKKKNDDVIAQNRKCAEYGAEIVADFRGSVRAPKPVNAPAPTYNGSAAVGLAAAVSGIKFVASYPMTPSTGVLVYLAAVADRYGIVVEQAEDEIAAVNMICGATYAGVPAMTTTSGGGFALMTEGLSLAGMLELPILIFLSQRPGPATGLPTRTAQEDIKFAANAGHGEFPRAIFAPGTPAQAYEITRQSLETAHKYQTPVILLFDQFLADMRVNIEALGDAPQPIDRLIEKNPAEDYARYALAENGISPRALPGSAAFVSCDSDEHTEDGRITEDLAVRVRLQDKRLAKIKGLTADCIPPQIYGLEDAEHLLITWGSTYGPCREAVDILNAAGGSYAMAHFAQVWPLNVEQIASVLNLDRRKSVTSVEGNATGLFAAMLREAGVPGDFAVLPKYDGMPFTAEEITERIKND